MKTGIVGVLFAYLVLALTAFLRAQSDINLTGYNLTFDDEFNTLSMTTASPKGASNWFAGVENSAGYFSQSTWASSAFTVNGGILSDTATLTGSTWYSGLCNSVDPTGAGFSQTYGYFEIRCQMPNSGSGAWPAFWLDSTSGITSQQNEEIDIFEWYGVCNTAGNYQAAMQEASHNWNSDGSQNQSAPYLYSPGTPMPGGAYPWQGYHIYGCQIDPVHVTWYIDGVQTNQIATPTAYMSKPFYLILDYALGGGWSLSGMVSGSSLNVDWVRVYSLPSSSSPVITSSTTASATVGTAFNYQITATNSPTGYNATNLPAGLSVNTTSGAITGTPTAAGTNTVALSATNANGTGSANLTLTVSSGGGGGGSLPSPWLNQDVGSTGAAGTATYSGSTYTLNGAGGGAYYSPDALQYAYQSVSGDCSITAQVVTQANTNANAKAGVMIRDGLGGTAGFADMVLCPGTTGNFFQYRADSGGPNSAGSTGAAPYWVRLTRAGNVFTGYVSSNGTSWTQVGTTTLMIPTAAYIGLAQSSGVYGTLGAATFNNVTVVGGGGGGGSAPAAPTGLTATPGNAQASLSWTASTGATSYNVYRGTSAGGESATAIATGITTTTYTNTGLTNGTAYYYKVAAVNTYGTSGYSNEATATPSSGGGGGSLPSPWLNQDVGSTGVAGTATYSGGTYTVNGAGGGAYYSPDALQYVYQSASGDCSITAQVVTQANTNANAKAGVMIRDGLGGTAAFADMVLCPGTTGAFFQYRGDTGNPNSAGTTGAAPNWVRVTRVGNVFTGYISSNGTTWTQVGTATMTMGSTISIGLAQSSGVYGTLGTATFNNVTGSP